MVKQRPAVQGMQVTNKMVKAAKQKQRQLMSVGDPLRGMRTRVKIADCTIGFAIANRNPFAAYEGNCPPVCMPDNIVLPTYKARVIAKGSASTGTAGIGYVGFAPNVCSSNGNCMQVTGALSVGTTATAPNAFTNLSTLEYATARFGNGSFGVGLLEARVCAAAVRIRYAGTVLNAGGTVYAYRSPSNTSIIAVAPDAWINLPETKKFSLTRDWVNLRWKISDPAEQNFDSATAAIRSMYIVIVSATGTAQPFEVECVNFHEMVGSSSGAKTLSHSDPVGFGVVQAVATSAPDANRGKGEHPKSILKQIENGIVQTTSYIKAGSGLFQAGKGAYEAGSEFASLMSGDVGALATMGEEAGAMALSVL